MRNPIIAAVRWLTDTHDPAPAAPEPVRAFEPLTADELEQLGVLAHRVTLELDTAYSGGATGAMILRATLAELATLEPVSGRELLSLDLPPLPDGARYRLRLIAREGAPTIYTGSTIAVDRESEPPPAFLRSVS